MALQRGNQRSLSPIPMANKLCVVKPEVETPRKKVANLLSELHIDIDASELKDVDAAQSTRRRKKDVTAPLFEDLAATVSKNFSVASRKSTTSSPLRLNLNGAFEDFFVDVDAIGPDTMDTVHHFGGLPSKESAVRSKNNSMNEGDSSPFLADIDFLGQDLKDFKDFDLFVDTPMPLPNYNDNAQDHEENVFYDESPLALSSSGFFQSPKRRANMNMSADLGIGHPIGMDLFASGSGCANSRLKKKSNSSPSNLSFGSLIDHGKLKFDFTPPKASDNNALPTPTRPIFGSQLSLLQPVEETLAPQTVKTQRRRKTPKKSKCISVPNLRKFVSAGTVTKTSSDQLQQLELKEDLVDTSFARVKSDIKPKADEVFLSKDKHPNPIFATNSISSNENDVSDDEESGEFRPKRKQKRKSKPCAEPGCIKNARGTTKFCVKHGGGKRCAIEGCDKGARAFSSFCSGHGGGKRCAVDGCNKGALCKSDYCRKHGKLHGLDDDGNLINTNEASQTKIEMPQPVVKVLSPSKVVSL